MTWFFYDLEPGFYLLRLGPLILQVKDPVRHPLLFSQRAKGLRVGRLWLRLYCG